MDLSVRSGEAEWMDDPAHDPEDFGRCLGDLESVNRVTFGTRPTLRWLARATQNMGSFSLLDVGFGHGDMLRAIARWAARRGKTAILSGIDLSPSSERAARLATPPELAIDYRTADVFAYEPPLQPDFVIAALMTHHLPDAKVVELLCWMDRVARRGWFNSDLHRHWLAYHGFRAMGAVARWHPMVRHDGAVSIAKSFRRADWAALLTEAGVEAEVRWMTPFKLCVGHLK